MRTIISTKNQPNDNEYLGLTFDSTLAQKDINKSQHEFMKQAERYRSNPKLHQACQFMQRNLRQHDRFPAYLITLAAVEKASLIDVASTQFYQILIDKKLYATYLFDKHEFIRFAMIEDEVAGWWVHYDTKKSGSKKLIFSPFNINLKADYNGEEQIFGNNLASQLQKRLAPLIAYIEFSPNELREVQAKDMSVIHPLRSTIKTENILPPLGYQIVGADWNTELVRTTPSAVRGHYRNQPCGKNRQERKIVWVQDHQRNGYHRRTAKGRDSA
jgi:hypothetical protein